MRTKVQGALLLNVVIGKSAAIFELLTSEDEALLIRRDTKANIVQIKQLDGEIFKYSPFLILDLGLHIIYSIGRLDL